MGFLGNMFGGNSNDQKQANNLLNYNAQAATPASQNAQTQGNTALTSGSNILNHGLTVLNQAQGTLAAPTNYFQSLLSGNSANTTAALAPQIGQIQGSTNATTQALSNLTPRGGGRSSTLFNLPYQAASQTSGLFNQARNTAAQALPGIAGEEASIGNAEGGMGLSQQGIGTNLLNTGVNFLNAGTNAASQYGGLSGQQRAQNYQTGNAFGSALGGLLGGIGGIFGL